MSEFDMDLMLIEEAELFRTLFLITGWTQSPFSEYVVYLPLDKGEFSLC